MSEKVDSEKILTEAKGIMDRFMDALGDVSVDEDIGVEREEYLRESKKPNESDEDFRNRMMKNAPNSDGEYVIAEKKSWK